MSGKQFFFLVCGLVLMGVLLLRLAGWPGFFS